MAIRVERITDVDQLSASTFAQWNALQLPSPMQSADWLIGWWDSFSRQANCQLCILLVFDGDLLIGVAPWYINRAWIFNNCLRFLGDGITCSDHSTMIIRSGYRQQVLTALSEWLKSEAGKRWHTIQLESVHRDNHVVELLIRDLAAGGCEQTVRDTVGCWTLELPSTWDDYLAGLSKNHRKRCRRWQRYFDSGKAVVEHCSVGDITDCWREIARLNLCRREGIGDRSAFADPRFHRFHQSVLPDLVARKQADVRLLRVEGELKAAEYVMMHDSTVFCYQSGMITSTGRDGYGNLSILALIRDAIERGYNQVDFLRGDEDYKKHWGSKRVDCVNYFVASNSIRGSSQVALNRAVDWARTLMSSPFQNLSAIKTSKTSHQA